MKKIIIWVIIIAFVISGLSAAVFANTSTMLDVKGSTIKVTPPAPKFTDAERQAELSRRRKAVAEKMADNSILILMSAEPRIYSNSVDFMYRQENNFVYLTGLKQKKATFVMTKSGGAVSEFIFLPKRDAFEETWNGKMYSNEEAARISGLANIIDGAETEAFLAAVKGSSAFQTKDSKFSVGSQASVVYLLLPNAARDPNGAREYYQEKAFSEQLGARKTENARPIFAQLRLIKSPYEIKIMRHAIAISNEAHMRSQAVAGRSKWEYEVQAEVEYTFRRRNADYWGYPSIVGCGPNATTLHYQIPAGEVTHGQLLLMDVGAEYDHYTADITRTFPVNGKFTKEQAAIYKIVYDAQNTVAKATKPGVTYGSLQQIAGKVIEDGLFDIGLITKKDGRQFRMWFMHGLGHWLGMNVHDVGDYATPLAPGMIFTNEPGIYIRPDTLEWMADTAENREFIAKVKPVFEKYKAIGVRIEDDMLVTENGVEWMTSELPRSIAEIESFMAKASREVQVSNYLINPMPRNANYSAAASRGYHSHAE